MQIIYTPADLAHYADSVQKLATLNGFPETVRVAPTVVNMGDWSITIAETVTVYPNDGIGMSFACNLFALLKWCHTHKEIEFNLRALLQVPGIRHADYIEAWLERQVDTTEQVPDPQLEDFARKVIEDMIGDSVDMSNFTMKRIE